MGNIVNRVETDTLSIRNLLHELIRLVEREGGHVHPDICFRERDGSFSVVLRNTSSPTDVPLFDLPGNLLLPIQAHQWRISGDLLYAPETLETFSPIQKELLDLQVALYNESGKIQWIRQYLPGVVLSAFPELLVAVQTLFPSFLETPVTEAEAFLQTRTLGHRRLFGTEASPQPASVLMPLVEFLNHSRQGAAYQTQHGGLRVRVAQLEGANECVACYGKRRDVLDLLLHYGFLDLQNPLVACVPVECEVEGLGRVSIENQSIRSLGKLDVPKLTFSDEGLVLSHISCDAEHPERALVAIRLALMGAFLRKGYMRTVVEKLANEVISVLCHSIVEKLDHFISSVSVLGRQCCITPLLSQAVEYQKQVLVKSLAV